LVDARIDDIGTTLDNRKLTMSKTALSLVAILCTMEIAFAQAGSDAPLEGSSNDSSKNETSSRRNPHLDNVAPVLSERVPDIGRAAFDGNLGMIRQLISSGANVEATGADGRAPLLLAAAGGHLEAVSVLLDAGARVNARDRAGATALHWATRRGEDRVALLILQHKPEVNVQDDAGDTPLMLAANAGNTNVVQALLSLGAKPELKDKFGLTAEEYAKINKYDDIVVLLRSGRK